LENPFEFLDNMLLIFLNKDDSLRIADTFLFPVSQ